MPVELLRDFMYAGFLMMVGFVLRTKIKFLQKLYIPSAVIGGIVGLLLGPEVLGKFCPVYLGFSDYIGSLAMPMLAIVFSTQFIGASFDKRVVKHSMATCFLNCGTAFMQVALGLVLAFLFIRAGSNIPLGFGEMPYTGFYGGHGVPASVAQMFEDLGHWDMSLGLSVGNTFATFGMVFGIIFGILIINIAARKGMISSNAGMKNMTGEELTGFIQAGNRPAAVDMVTKNDAINPVAFQMAIICTIMFLSYKLLDVLLKVPSFKYFQITIPVIALGIATSVLGKKTSLGKYLDRKSVSNVSGAALEFLIASSVATTKLSIFVDYGVEILVFTLVILAATMAYVLFFGKMWHKDNWVENCLGTFGLASGVLATGFLLIRVADPDTKTTAATNLAIGNTFSTFAVQLPLLFVFPAYVVSNPNGSMLLALVGWIGFTIVGCVLSKILHKTA